MDKRFKRTLNPKYNHSDHVYCHGGCLGGNGCDHIFFANRNNMRANHNHAVVDYTNTGSYASKVHFRNSMRGKTVGGPIGGNLRIQTRSDLKRHNNELNKMCILHLNLIQEQNDEMIEKDKEIEKRDNEISMLRLKIRQLEVLDKEIAKRDNEISRLCNVNKNLEEKLNYQRQLHRKHKTTTSFEVNSLPIPPQAKIKRHGDSHPGPPVQQRDSEDQNDILHLQHSQFHLHQPQTQYHQNNQSINFNEHQDQERQVLVTSSHTTVNIKANGEFNGKKVRSIFMERVNQESGNQDTGHLKQPTIPNISDAIPSYDNEEISNNIQVLSDQQEDDIDDDMHDSTETKHEGEGADIYLDALDVAIGEEVVNTQEEDESCSTGTTVIETLAKKSQQVEITEVVTLKCAENHVGYEHVDCINETETNFCESDVQTHDDGVIPIMLMHTQQDAASYFSMVSEPNKVLTDTGSFIANSKNLQTPAAHSTPTQEDYPQQQEQEELTQKEVLKRDQMDFQTTEERPAVIEMGSVEMKEEDNTYENEKEIEREIIEVLTDGQTNVDDSLCSEKHVTEQENKKEQPVTIQDVQKTEPHNHNLSSPNKIKEKILLVNEPDNVKKKQIVQPIKQEMSSVIAESKNQGTQMPYKKQSLIKQHIKSTVKKELQLSIESKGLSNANAFQQTCCTPLDKKKQTEQKLQFHIQQQIQQQNAGRKMEVRLNKMRNNANNSKLIFPPQTITPDPTPTSTPNSTPTPMTTLLTPTATDTRSQSVTKVESTKSVSATNLLPENAKIPQNVSATLLTQDINEAISLPSIRPDENSLCLSTRRMYATRGWEDSEFHHDLEFYLDEAGELNKDNPKLEIPKWEVITIPPPKGTEGTDEDISNEAYDNRHKKLVDEEKKRKRRDEHYWNEQILRFRLQEKEQPEEKKKDLPLTTLYPLPDDVEEVCFVSRLPVQAFGECIVRPNMQRINFHLPWLDTNNTEIDANSLKARTPPVATLGSNIVSTTVAQAQKQQLTSSYEVIKMSKKQRNHTKRTTNKTANNLFVPCTTTGGNREKTNLS